MSLRSEDKTFLLLGRKLHPEVLVFPYSMRGSFISFLQLKYIFIYIFLICSDYKKNDSLLEFKDHLKFLHIKMT